MAIPKAHAAGFAVMGLGDIVSRPRPLAAALPPSLSRRPVSPVLRRAQIIPGLYISFLYRTDRKYHLYRLALALYSLALVVTVLVLALTRHGQPALLYIVPMVTLPPLLLAWRRGDFAGLWREDEESNGVLVT